MFIGLAIELWWHLFVSGKQANGFLLHYSNLCFTTDITNVVAYFCLWAELFFYFLF